MQDRVFIHIGSPKSGTTYLQDRFRLNVDLLARQGLTYPMPEAGSHFLGALEIIQRSWGGELANAKGEWAELSTDARRARGNALISHEILAAATPAQVDTVFNSFPGREIHVVYTARDLARQIPAEWQETVKHRARRPFRGFMHQLLNADRWNSENWFWRVQHLPDVLNRWSHGLPPERIHVVTVPQTGAPPSTLWGRMCSVLGLDPTLEYADSALMNSSIGIAEVAVIRRLNELLPVQLLARSDYVRIVREGIVRDSLAKRENQMKAEVPQARHAFFDEVTEEWIDWIAGAGVDVVGDIDDLRPVWPDPAELHRHPDQPLPADVADAAIQALAVAVLEAARDEPSPTPAPTLAQRATQRFLGSS